jgi:hypothetical protein
MPLCNNPSMRSVAPAVPHQMSQEYSSAGTSSAWSKSKYSEMRYAKDSRAERWNQAFQMWRDCASEVDYAAFPDPRAHLVIHLRGLADVRDLNTTDEMRDWLWRRDFAAFVNAASAAPTYDAVASSFQDIFERTEGWVSVAMEIAMTLFLRSSNAACVHIEELRWAVYLFGRDYALLQVVDVSRELLAAEHANIRLLGPWPDVRPTISWTPRIGGPIEMEIDELDVAHRRRMLLLAMCERKCENQFLGPTDKLAAGSFNVDRSMIVRVVTRGACRPRPPAVLPAVLPEKTSNTRWTLRMMPVLEFKTLMPTTQAGFKTPTRKVVR